ncbi:hypothetical protein GGX14DRAFT_404915 [Mycena pura]|uniref:Uncharacterized protein n=1 Tax=Mycena pura TaxID=153505 RepID=A0AAD6UXF5_9AGAR|nr:hypothetical protein GGX14DRAFT_404915 [Mycena pura]
MYHASLARVFQPLKDAMTTPDIVRCPDGHFRRIIYGLGPYIADYPEQNWCPKCEARPDHLDADDARLRTESKTNALIRAWDPGTLWDDYGIRSDVVVIKGTFKDHIVTWVNKYLVLEHGEKRALEIIQDIANQELYKSSLNSFLFFFKTKKLKKLKKHVKLLGAFLGYVP